MLNKQQKQTAQSIINIFETSSVRGNYSLVVVLPEDSGHLTFGRSQTTLGSGNLHLLIKQYCALDNTRFGARLKRYLPQLQQQDVGLDTDYRLHNLLRASADDPAMLATQDDFFEKHYWENAVRRAKKAGIECALGVTIVYDSTVHGSWKYIRNKTNKNKGKIQQLGEKKWLRAYVATRRNWLANHKKNILKKTVYRQDTFIDMMEFGYWDLPLPMVVRGLEISKQTLKATPPGSFDGPTPGGRTLTFTSPMQKGLDVREVQLGLSEAGYKIEADGWYGSGTATIVKKWQKDKRVPASGDVEKELVAGFLDQQPGTMFA